MIRRTQKEMNKSHASSIGPGADINITAGYVMNYKYLNKLYSDETSMVCRTQKGMYKSSCEIHGPMAEINPVACNDLNNKYLN